jgi:phosphoribosylformylglycinamidine synthase
MLLGSGNIASKQWVYRQYDHMVRTNTAVLPGADAAVVRIKETRRAMSMTLDGNGRYCAANPREGAKLIVAEAARNVVCTGARPIAITNCLNFASPERPEVMWSFSEVIDGMAEACRTFNTPVVSGNVSFYNETEGKGILPTPVIGMLGLVEDVRRVVTPGFKKDGDLIALLGTTNDDLAMSEYAVTIGGVSTESIVTSGLVPKLDLELETAVQRACLEAAEAGLLHSAHDCSDGGLAVSIAESCFSSLAHPAIGASLELHGSPAAAAWLFSESPSRIVITFASESGSEVEAIAARAGAPLTIIGKVGGTRLQIAVDNEQVIHCDVNDLETTWRDGLSRKLQAEAVAAASE